MMQAIQKSFAQWMVGDTASFEFELTQEAVNRFVELSGDRNPLHVDEAYASTTSFGKPVAHGMIGGALFSQLIGMHLPGIYALYLSQTLTFRKPMFVGVILKVKGEVQRKTEVVQTLTLATAIEDKITGEVYVDGTALVKVLV